MRNIVFCVISHICAGQFDFFSFFAAHLSVFCIAFCAAENSAYRAADLSARGKAYPLRKARKSAENSAEGKIIDKAHGDAERENNNGIRQKKENLRPEFTRNAIEQKRPVRGKERVIGMDYVRREGMLCGKRYGGGKRAASSPYMQAYTQQAYRRKELKRVVVAVYEPPCGGALPESNQTCRYAAQNE